MTIEQALRRLVDALQPFVLANSSEEFVTLVVRSSDIAKARAALAQMAAPVGYADPDSLRALARGDVDAASLVRADDAEDDVPVYAAPVAAADMVLVPREPTDDMLNAMRNMIDFDRTDQRTDVLEHESQTAHAVTSIKTDMQDAYRAMLAAAPAAQAAKPAQAGDAQDAARYRWLRGRHWSDGGLYVVRGSRDAVRPGTYCPNDDLLDAVIDAQIKEQP